MTDKDDDIANALRARESLAHDAQPGDHEFNAQSAGSGLHFGSTDEPVDDAEAVLLDDGVDET